MSKFLISCKESRIETNRSFYGSFVIGPFHPSESLTIATALRRSLLAELPGIGIVSVQIEGAAHEYSNLRGVRDSVLDILLNLREIVLKKSTKTIRPQIGYLRSRGPGTIVAGDLCLPPFIQCVDPKQHIATLADDGVLNMKFIISEGKNYIKGKPKMMIDVNQFKKRRLNLKKLNQICQNTSLLTNYYNYLKINKKRDLLNQSKFSRTTIFLNSSPNQKKEGSTFIQKAKMNFAKIKKNSVALNLLNVDAVFNPVLNVNYIIEINDHQILENLFEKTNQIERRLGIIQTKSILDVKKSPEFLKENLENQFKQVKLESNVSYLKTLLKYQINFDRFSKNLSQGHSKKTGFLKGVSSAKTAKMILEHFDTKNDSFHQNKIWSSDAQKDHVFHNNIILEVWTNGSLHPREAVYEAFKYLIRLFSKLKQIQSIEPLVKYEAKNIDFVNYLKNNSQNSMGLLPLNQENFVAKYASMRPNPISKSGQTETTTYGQQKFRSTVDLQSQTFNKKKMTQIGNKELDKLESMDISSLKIALRPLMALKKRNINTIADLMKLTKKDLLNIPYVGEKSIQDIKKSLLKIGFDLKENN